MFNNLRELWPDLLKLGKDFYQGVTGIKEDFLGEKIRNNPIFKRFSPNWWCYLRATLGVPVAWLNNAGHTTSSILLYLFGLLTDLIDGAHARATGQETEAGARLDANMDKVFIAGILLAADGDLIKGLIVWILLSIEVILFLTANWLKPLLNSKLKYCLKAGSNRFGKTKMFIQGFGILFLLLDSSIMALLGEVLLWISIAFAIGSFLRHLQLVDKDLVKAQIKDLSEKELAKWSERQKKMRIVTVPNVITLSRLLIVIPAALAMIDKNWWLATPLLVWTFNSDWIDGWFARKYDQATILGKRLEPISDNLVKYSMSIAYLFLYFDIPIARYLMFAILAEEILIAALNSYILYKYKIKDLVTLWGQKRIIVHFSAFTLVYLYTAEYLNWLIDYNIVVSISKTGILYLSFGAMLLSSLFALWSYTKQYKKISSQRCY